MDDPDGHWSWLKFAYSTVKGAVNGYISAKVAGKNIFLSTMAGAVTGAISGIGMGLNLSGVAGDVVEAMFDGISVGIGSIFDQLLDMYNKLCDIFEGYTEAAPWVKEVLTEIYNILFVDLPENAVIETLTGGD